MPSNLESIDIINAADVLEHIDNIHDIFNSCLNVANKNCNCSAKHGLL